MFHGARLFVFRFLLWALCVVFAQPVLAAPALSTNADATHGFAPGGLCTALAPQASLRGRATAALASDPGKWDCTGATWPISGSRSTLVRIDMAGHDPASGDALATRLTRFEKIWITAIGQGGSTARIAIDHDDLTFSSTRWIMHMPLPRLKGPVSAYVVEVEGARHPGIFSDMSVEPPAGPQAAAIRELVLAALCGLMCMPLVLNFAFYRVLRQRFVLWHALAVFSMLIQTLVTSGLVNRFASLSLMQLSLLSAFSIATTIVAAAQFFADLVEPGMLPRYQRRALDALTPWMAFWTVYYLFASGPLLPSVADLYYLAFIPVLAVLLGSMVTAALRGSRTVWFQIIGWAPLIATALSRIASLLGMTEAPLGFMVEQHLSIAFEVIVTSLGAADRFMAIKNQRDHAVAQSKVLENLAERDPLTGLYNRRGFEERYARLTREGYQTMAIIDLDHFKRINDTMGHATGDAVLRAVALALMPDEDTIAVRLGGEEFLLLMRGEDAPERAERRRTSIPARIANEVPGLDGLVTASMGMVTMTSPTRFATLYSRCDSLLYAAKAAGRNRSMRELSMAEAAAGVPVAMPASGNVISLH